MSRRDAGPLFLSMFVAILAATFSHWWMPFLGPPEPTGDSPELVQEWQELPPRADVPLTAEEAAVATYVPPRAWGKNPFLTAAEAAHYGSDFAYVGGAGPSARPGTAGPRLTAIIQVQGGEQVAIIDGVATSRGEATGGLKVIDVAERDVVVDTKGVRRVLRVTEDAGVDVVSGGSD